MGKRIEINGQFSAWRKVNSVVPQGSVCRPLFANIFINSLQEVVNSQAAGAPDKIVSGQWEGGEAGKEKRSNSYHQSHKNSPDAVSDIMPYIC